VCPGCPPPGFPRNMRWISPFSLFGFDWTAFLSWAGDDLACLLDYCVERIASPCSRIFPFSERRDRIGVPFFQHFSFSFREDSFPISSIPLRKALPSELSFFPSMTFGSKPTDDPPTEREAFRFSPPTKAGPLPPQAL